jgi:hypothetical protein
MTSLGSDFINKHVNEIEEKDDTCWVPWVIKEVVDGGGLSGWSNDKVGSDGDGNNKLAVRKEILNSFIVEDSHDERTCKAVERSDNAKRMNVREIVRIFIERNKVVSREGIVNRDTTSDLFSCYYFVEPPRIFDIVCRIESLQKAQDMDLGRLQDSFHETQ